MGHFSQEANNNEVINNNKHKNSLLPLPSMSGESIKRILKLSHLQKANWVPEHEYAVTGCKGWICILLYHNVSSGNVRAEKEGWLEKCWHRGTLHVLIKGLLLCCYIENVTRYLSNSVILCVLLTAREREQGYIMTTYMGLEMCWIDKTSFHSTANGG